MYIFVPDKCITMKLTGVACEGCVLKLLSYGEKCNIILKNEDVTFTIFRTLSSYMIHKSYATHATLQIFDDGDYRLEKH